MPDPGAACSRGSGNRRSAAEFTQAGRHDRAVAPALGRRWRGRRIPVAGILKFFGSVIGIIFLIGLIVVIGLLMLIF